MSFAAALKTAVASHSARLEASIDEVLARHAAGAEASWSSPLAGVEPEYATPDHVVWAEIAPREGRPGFLATEFTHPWLMDVGFLRLLYRIRVDVWVAAEAGELARDVPMRVISDARTTGGASKSEHLNRPCRAVDLQVYSAYDRAVLVIAAVRRGIVRFGPYPGKNRSGERGWPAHARDASGLHLDASTVNPSPRAWTRF